jgi:hypothetical protein
MKGRIVYFLIALLCTQVNSVNAQSIYKVLAVEGAVVNDKKKGLIKNLDLMERNSEITLAEDAFVAIVDNIGNCYEFTGPKKVILDFIIQPSKKATFKKIQTLYMEKHELADWHYTVPIHIVFPTQKHLKVGVGDRICFVWTSVNNPSSSSYKFFMLNLLDDTVHISVLTNDVFEFDTESLTPGTYLYGIKDTYADASSSLHSITILEDKRSGNGCSIKPSDYVLAALFFESVNQWEKAELYYGMASEISGRKCFALFLEKFLLRKESRINRR